MKKMLQRFVTLTIATMLSICIDMVNAFQVSHPTSSAGSLVDGLQCAPFKRDTNNSNHKRNLLVVMSGNKNDNEYMGDFDLFENDENLNNKGDELAQQFYKQLRIREEQKKNMEENQKQNDKDNNALKDVQPKQQQNKPPPVEPSKKLSEDELRKRNRKAFLKRKEMSVSRQKRRDGGENDNDANDDSDSKSPISSASPSVEAIRFFSASKGVTGSGLQGGNSLFSEPSTTSSNGGNRSGGNNARQNMIQQEFNLLRIASSETAILIQIGLVVLLLVFELSIGINGGITDGSDRFGDEPNEFNGVGYDDENTIMLQQQKEDEDVEEILKNMSPSSGSVGGGSVWL